MKSTIVTLSFEYTKDLLEQAYNEGRRHQEIDDFPDVGMSWPKTFTDTEAYSKLCDLLK